MRYLAALNDQREVNVHILLNINGNYGRFQHIVHAYVCLLAEKPHLHHERVCSGKFGKWHSPPSHRSACYQHPVSKNPLWSELSVDERLVRLTLAKSVPLHFSSSFSNSTWYNSCTSCCKNTSCRSQPKLFVRPAVLTACSMESYLGDWGGLVCSVWCVVCGV